MGFHSLHKKLTRIVYLGISDVRDCEMPSLFQEFFYSSASCGRLKFLKIYTLCYSVPNFILSIVVKLITTLSMEPQIHILHVLLIH